MSLFYASAVMGGRGIPNLAFFFAGFTALFFINLLVYIERKTVEKNLRENYSHFRVFIACQFLRCFFFFFAHCLLQRIFRLFFVCYEIRTLILTLAIIFIMATNRIRRLLNRTEPSVIIIIVIISSVYTKANRHFLRCPLFADRYNKL